MFKKFVSLMIVVAMLAVVCSNALAVEADHTPSVEEILNQYHEKVFEEITASEIDVAVMNTWQASTSTQTLEQETVNELVQAGYEAYNITSSNYSEMEDALQTDLASMGIDPDGSYIVVVSGEDFGGCENAGVESRTSGVQPTATAGSSFEYIYGGKTYTMRYLTITTSDNPAYTRFGECNLLENQGEVLLENILNTVISATLDNITGPLNFGTLASICGIQFADFGNTDPTIGTLEMHAAASWTRIFTQIWIESESRWVSQLHVEYVSARSYLDGMYYNPAINAPADIPRNTKTKMAYSAHLDDRVWRIEQAIIGFRTDKVYYDLTGKVQFWHEGRVVIALLENF